MFHMSNDTRLHPSELTEVILGDGPISLEEFLAVARYKAKVSFSQSYRERVRASRSLIETFLQENRLIYGVTTGFGDNVSKVISPEDATTLQHNIIRSHAVSVGEPLETEVVRAIQLMMLLNLGQGYSGVRLEVLQLIADLLNQEITPYAPGEGSVAYLAPEAHMTLVLIGEGKAWYQGELLAGEAALHRAGLQPVSLGCKEGLALINGTTSVTAMAALALYNAIQVTKTADLAGAMSLEALKGTIKACDPRLHSVKKHKEQASTARNIVSILEGSEIAEKYIDHRLQDALSLRCIPQLHGACKKTLKDARETIEHEMDSTGDNPIIFPQGDDGVALMGGNFDGTFVGISADAMSIALANLAKMSERRIDRLVNHHHSELPSFLVANPGLNSGYMIPQYTAAGLLGEIKVLSHPSTVDSMSTSANQEDLVSLAYYAAKKAYQISKKVEYIVAIELMTAAQALDFHKPLKPSPITSAVCQKIRSKVPTVEADRYFYTDIESIHDQLHHGEFVRIVEEKIGDLCF